MSVAFLVTLARALVVHACAEMVRFALTTVAPDIPALVCTAIGLVRRGRRCRLLLCSGMRNASESRLAISLDKRQTLLDCVPTTNICLS